MQKIELVLSFSKKQILNSSRWRKLSLLYVAFGLRNIFRFIEEFKISPEIFLRPIQRIAKRFIFFVFHTLLSRASV